MRLELEIKKDHLDLSSIGDGRIMLTPPIDEDYWLYRVVVSNKQAVVGFKKFNTIGIGFQYEKDWNTNLPWSTSAEEIYDHIKHNRLGVPKNRCIEAIEIIQSAVRQSMEAVVPE